MQKGITWDKFEGSDKIIFHFWRRIYDLHCSGLVSRYEYKRIQCVHCYNIIHTIRQLYNSNVKRNWENILTKVYVADFHTQYHNYWVVICECDTVPYVG